MKKYIIVIVACIPVFLFAQDSLHQEVAPKRGVEHLAIQYYGIEFTKEQRELLKGKEIEFIFQVDTVGKALLGAVNGITDAAILDSLRRKTDQLEPFYPSIRNGKAQPSIYFLRLTFPSYRMSESQYWVSQNMRYYRRARLSDFEYIQTSNERIDILFAGVLNQFAGRPAEYISLGGGMKMDITVTDRRSMVWGLTMGVYANKIRNEYPIQLARPQLSPMPTLLVGALFGKWFPRFNVQGELNFAVQNVTEKIGEKDPGWKQLKGWSPGVLLNYPVLVGKKQAGFYYGAPSVVGNYLNLHVGLRYLGLSLPQASGLMLELGVGYRLTTFSVRDFKFKDSFLKQ